MYMKMLFCLDLHFCSGGSVQVFQSNLWSGADGRRQKRHQTMHSASVWRRFSCWDWEHKEGTRVQRGDRRLVTGD